MSCFQQIWRLVTGVDAIANDHKRSDAEGWTRGIRPRLRWPHSVVNAIRSMSATQLVSGGEVGESIQPSRISSAHSEANTQ
jgi:hypothetical protein